MRTKNYGKQQTIETINLAHKAQNLAINDPMYMKLIVNSMILVM